MKGNSTRYVERLFILFYLVLDSQDDMLENYDDTLYESIVHFQRANLNVGPLFNKFVSYCHTNPLSLSKGTKLAKIADLPLLYGSRLQN